jgi:Tfp pilus assembly protein PilO
MEIPNFMKIFITLIIILFMGGIFYALQWRGPIDEKKQAEQQIETLNQELQTVLSQKEEIPKLQAQIREKEAELQATIQQELTPESETDFVPSYMADVEKLVEAQRIRMNDPDFIITAMTPESNSDNSSSVKVLSSYPARSFQMSLTGRYTTIIDFLRQLGALKLKRLVTVSKLNLSRTAGIDKKDYAKSPILTITMPISVYLRKEGN